MFRLAFLAFAALSLLADDSPFTPRDGWAVSSDLIQTGSWGCVSGVDAAMPGQLTVSAGTNFNTVTNTVGPRLQVTGDFSVMASFSSAGNPGTYLTLFGALSTGQWWEGIKRLDVGIGDQLTVGYWLGDSPTAVSQSFPDLPGRDDPYVLEVARMGSQIVVYVNDMETARIDDPGLFAAGKVYLGFNIAPGNTLTVKSLGALVPADSLDNAKLVAPYLRLAQRTGSALRDTAEARGFLVGAAVNPALLSMDSYAETLGGEFNTVVAENDMKFAATHPAPTRYSFCAADNLIAFAQTNHMKVRGHTLVWHQALPDWLTKGDYSSDEAWAILHDHIKTVMGHFKGKLISWDVVNESIAYGAPYGDQPSYWLNKLGPGYVDQAFRWAREADPDVKLFYNETGGEGLGAKSDKLYNLLTGMQDRGVPLDGVGLQMHVDVPTAPSFAAIAANIQRLAALGLEVHITEMDVRIPQPATQLYLDAQARVYQNVLRACQTSPKCTTLMTWGVTDAYSWIPGAYKGFGSALLFDEKYAAKPAYQSLVNQLTP